MPLPLAFQNAEALAMKPCPGSPAVAATLARLAGGQPFTNVAGLNVTSAQGQVDANATRGATTLVDAYKNVYQGDAVLVSLSGVPVGAGSLFQVPVAQVNGQPNPAFYGYAVGIRGTGVGGGPTFAAALQGALDTAPITNATQGMSVLILQAQYATAGGV